MKLQASATIRIDVFKFEFDEKYYSFHYRVSVTNRFMVRQVYDGIYESSHSRWNDIEDFKSTLINGYAIQLAIEKELTNIQS